MVAPGVVENVLGTVLPNRTTSLSIFWLQALLLHVERLLFAYSTEKEVTKPSAAAELGAGLAAAFLGEACALDLFIHGWLATGLGRRSPVGLLVTL